MQTAEPHHWAESAESGDRRSSQRCGPAMTTAETGVRTAGAGCSRPDSRNVTDAALSAGGVGGTPSSSGVVGRAESASVVVSADGRVDVAVAGTSGTNGSKKSAGCACAGAHHTSGRWSPWRRSPPRKVCRVLRSSARRLGAPRLPCARISDVPVLRAAMAERIRQFGGPPGGCRGRGRSVEERSFGRQWHKELVRLAVRQGRITLLAGGRHDVVHCPAMRAGFRGQRRTAPIAEPRVGGIGLAETALEGVHGRVFHFALGDRLPATILAQARRVVCWRQLPSRWTRQAATVTTGPASLGDDVASLLLGPVQRLVRPVQQLLQRLCRRAARYAARDGGGLGELETTIGGLGLDRGAQPLRHG